MTFDELTFRPLNPIRKKILHDVFKSKPYTTEFIAYHSEQLYSAYEVRVKRLRILGAAIFNWPLLGVALLVYFGFTNWAYSIYIVIVSITLCVVSFIAWRNLYRRAYNFRKKACDAIIEDKKVNKKR